MVVEFGPVDISRQNYWYRLHRPSIPSLESSPFVEKIPIENPTRAGSRLTSVEAIGAGFGSSSPTDQVEK
jgi:hypothetical protein